MANSMLDSPPQLPAAGPWGSLFAVQEPAKPRRVSVALPFAPKKMPAYRYGMKRNLEMCTEALGCETGGVDPAADDADEGVERKRKYREEEEEETKVERTERRARVLPPPLTTLAAGATRMRMVHERRGGRLEVYAVRASGMEAERSGGRLRLRLMPCAGCNAAAVCSSQQEPQEAEEDETEEVDQQRQQQCVVPKYVRRERCLKVESGATAARCSIKWEQEQAAAFWVATT
nr:protein FANTASTIC FOUR 3 [Aegilops tauschii subsp. strangulata]